MQKLHQWWPELGLMVLGILLLAAVPRLLTPPQRLPVSGLEAPNARIVDPRGRVHAHTTELPATQRFTAKYVWTLPPFVTVHAGDTMTLTLPDNLQVPRDLRFDLKNQTGGRATIGTFRMRKGARSGTIRLNGALATTGYNRQGYLNLSVVGSTITAPTGTQAAAPGVSSGGGGDRVSTGRSSDDRIVPTPE